MPELVLDQRQRDPLVQQLDSVRMAELVGSEAPADACLDRDWCSWRRAAPADQACPRVGPAITENNGPTGNVARSESHGCSAVLCRTRHKEQHYADALVIPTWP